MLTTLANALDSTMLSVTAPQALLTLILAGVAIRWATKKKKNMNLPPCPPTLPLLGNAWELKASSTLTKKTLEWKAKYGPVMIYYTGPIRWLLLSSIEAVTEAYTQKGSDFATKPHLTSLDYVSKQGKDIAFAPYDESLVYRRKIAMLAIRQFLAGTQHTDRIHQVVTEDVNNMLANKGPFDPHAYLSHMIFNILHGICFGYTLSIDDPTYREILGIMDRTTGEFSGFWEDFFPPLRHFPTKKYRDVMADFDHFREYITKNIAVRRANLDEHNLETVVDYILVAQKQTENQTLREGFTDLHMASVMMDVFFAGNDTSRSTLDWLLLNVVAREDVQNRLHDEIDATMGGEAPGREHRLNLVYTEAVIMEVMRQFPVVPMGLPHETMRDTQVGGYDVPAQTQVMVNQYAILNDPKHWESPENFMPERYIEADGSKLKPRPHSWIPFSIGPRNCIGEFLAKMNLLYTVAGVFQKLHFTLPPGAGTPDFTPVDRWLSLVCSPYEIVATPRKQVL